MSTVAALRGGARARPALRPAAVLAVASASSFLVYLDATIVNVAFPDVRASFAGAVFGVALLVAILGPAPGPGAYDAGWWAMAALALLAVVPVLALPRRSGSAIPIPPLPDIVR